MSSPTPIEDLVDQSLDHADKARQGQVDADIGSADSASSGSRSSRVRRMLGLAVWASFIGGYFLFARSRGLGPIDAAEELRQTLSGAWWAPLAFVVFYMARPLVLFPATVLTIFAGLVFGPVSGTLLTLVGSSLSTALTYLIGRFFSPDMLSPRLTSLIGPLIDRARERPFESALVMRLLYLPFDAVGYVAGFARLKMLPFLVGSFIGTIPGTVAFVGFGASVDSLNEGTPSFDFRILGASALLAVAGSLFARWLRNRTDRSNETGELSPSPQMTKPAKESL